MREGYYSLVLSEKQILKNIEHIKGERDCFNDLLDFLKNPKPNKICALYGLRRTGKTVLMMQAYKELVESGCNAVFLEVKGKQEFYELEQDLDKIAKTGAQVVFIDEITKARDFIGLSSSLANYYSSLFTLVVAGTDSMVLREAGNDSLYDRIYPIHTTYIPFREFHRLKESVKLDGYLRNELGLSMLSDLTRYEATHRYIRTSIVDNVKHSLEESMNFTPDEILERKISYEDLIYRVLNDVNHRFVSNVFRKELKLSDLGTAAQNIRRAEIGELNDYVSFKEIDQKVDERLGIKRSMPIIRNEAFYLKHYKNIMKQMDLFVDDPYYELSEAGLNRRENINTILTLPGMRYSLAAEVIYAILEDSTFATVPINVQNVILERIEQNILGLQLEEILRYDLRRYYSNRAEIEVAKISAGSAGEFDIAIINKKTGEADLFEVKHSSEYVPSTEEMYGQDKNFYNKQLMENVQRFFNPNIKGVIYNGPDRLSGDIKYLNAKKLLLDQGIIETLKEKQTVSLDCKITESAKKVVPATIKTGKRER